jgi:hypothetical protein
MKIIYIPFGIDGYLLNSGSQRLRCEWMAPLLGADIYNRTQDLENYDVIIYQKSYVGKEVRIIAEKYKHKLQIFDLCDPEHWFRKDLVQYMIDRCKIIISSNQWLADELKKTFNREVEVIPDRQKLDFYTIRKVHEDVPVKLVWFGYCDNFYLVKPYLDEIKERQLPLLIIGDYPVNYGIYFQWTLDTFCSDIIRGDVVFNPIVPWKSNNKTTTAWTLGMPVASNIEEIDRFLDYKERIKESELRINEVKEKWDIKLSANELFNLIMEKK